MEHMQTAIYGSLAVAVTIKKSIPEGSLVVNPRFS
jgi:hypothetical protein